MPFVDCERVMARRRLLRRAAHGPVRGGARKHRPRPARDGLFLASPRGNKDLAAWWRKAVGRLFIGIAAEDARSLVITRQPKRPDLGAAYREWQRVVSDSIQGIWVGDYKAGPVRRLASLHRCGHPEAGDRAGRLRRLRVPAERKTGLEPATLALATPRSTN